jgi:hypothetical protein
MSLSANSHGFDPFRYVHVPTDVSCFGSQQHLPLQHFAGVAPMLTAAPSSTHPLRATPRTGAHHLAAAVILSRPHTAIHAWCAMAGRAQVWCAESPLPRGPCLPLLTPPGRPTQSVSLPVVAAHHWRKASCGHAAISEIHASNIND